MLRAESMCKVNILLLNRHLSEVTRRLGEVGVVHLVDAAAQSRMGLLSRYDCAEDSRVLKQQLEGCRQLMELLDIAEVPADVPAEVPAAWGSGSLCTVEGVSARLSSLRSQVDGLNGEIALLLQDVNGLSQQRNRLEAYPVQDVSLDVLRGLSHFQILAGRLPEESVGSVKDALKDRCIVCDVEGRPGSILVMCSKKDSSEIESSLEKSGFVKIAEPEGFSGTASEEGRALDGKLLSLRSQLEEARGKVQALGESCKEELWRGYRYLSEQWSLQGVRSHYGRTKSLVCISGWVPGGQVSRVREEVSAATGGTGLVEVIDACSDPLVCDGAEQVPTKLSEHPLAVPFRNLITNFGIPHYSEVDPTLFFGLTFVLLFGYMFGDVGHGLVFMLAGLVMRLLSRETYAVLHDYGWLMLLCGGCATLFGVGYGSIFGYEELFPALWLHPMHGADVSKLLLTAIGVGTVFTSIAIILNIVNNFIIGEYYEGTFHRFGVMGLLFFWSAIGIGVVGLTGHVISSWMFIPLLVPMALVMIREPLHHVLHGESPFHGSGVLGTFLEVCIEGLEIVTGYFSGTLSFIRIGAFAISHAALCYAIYMLQGLLVNLPLPVVWQIIVVVLGNLLVICFEGMVVMIQCIRLEYYELFGKYFKGGGIEYKPFKLQTRGK